MIPEVKIGDKWTFQDYGLILTPSLSIDEAAPKENYIEIPYGDGSLDLTEALTGEVNYKDRNLEMELVEDKSRLGWQKSMSDFINDVNGRRVDMILPIYSDHHFNGRLNANYDFSGDMGIATIKVTGVVSPFMLKNTMTVVTATVPSSGTLTLNLKNERMTTLPEFTISATSQIVSGTDSYSHSAGTFTLANIYLVQGNNQITIKAVAGTTVSISYQEGAL